MTNDRPTSSFEPPHPIFSTWVGVVLLFALFALIALVIVAASPRGDHYEKTRAKARAEKLKAVTDETNKSLTTYAWVDKTKGVARIPIGDAMRLTLVELAQKKPAPGSPIVPAEAQNAGAQAAAPATPPPVGPLAASSPSAGATPKVTSVTGPNSENRGQPAAATNPAPVQPGTQPGGAATPAASPPAAAAQPGRAVVTPSPSAPGTPLPIRGKRP
ncbi:MAG: hypothetical protein ABI944_03900 [Chthoniobacterales bacterium]